MKPRTLYMPEPWTRLIHELINEGYYANVSDAIRTAIRDLLQFHGKIGRGNE